MMRLTLDILDQRLRPTLRSWLADINALIPSRWQSRPFTQRLIVTAVGTELRFKLASRNANIRWEAFWSQELQDWKTLDAVDNLRSLAHDHLIDLHIPAEYILQQTITLPRLAGEDLQGAITFGLPTWTPFALEDVYFAARVISSDAQQIVVSIRYTIRTRIQPLFEQVSRTGFAPDRLAFDADGHWVTLLNARKARRASWQKRLDIALVAAALILLLLLVLAVGRRQSVTLATYQAHLREEIVSLQKAEAERIKLEKAASHRTAVVRRRAKHPSLSEVLSFIGKQLPSEAALVSLEIKAAKGKFEAVGVDSAALRAAWQGVNMITDVKVESLGSSRPVTVTFGISEITQ